MKNIKNLGLGALGHAFGVGVLTAVIEHLKSPIVASLVGVVVGALVAAITWTYWIRRFGKKS